MTKPRHDPERPTPSFRAPFVPLNDDRLRLRESVPPSLRVFTKPETAELLHVSVRQVERLIAAGKLQPIFLGRSVRITEAALADFLAACAEG